MTSDSFELHGRLNLYVFNSLMFMKRLSVEEESFQILFFSDSDTVTTALIYMECTAADGGSIVAYVPL